MLTDKSQKSLSRRGSKLLVEMVIGVIGVLGIVLAETGEKRSSLQPELDYSQQVIASPLARQEIDWLEILF